MTTATKYLTAIALALTLTACASSQEAAPTPDAARATRYLKHYAGCWAEAPSAQEAQLRCQHLAPGPDHYLRRDENGEAVYLTGGKFPVPRYDYVPEDHADCLEEIQEWFRKAYDAPSAKSAYLFAEAVCAVPPPRYTNVED